MKTIRSSTLAFAVAACATIANIAGLTEAAPQPPVTFSKDIAPILFNRCGRCHHPNGPAPFSLLTYADARPRATLIALATKKRDMPPWKAEPGYGEFAGQQPLTGAEIDVIQDWVAQGALEGNRRDLPPVPKFAEGWQLGTILNLTSGPPLNVVGANTLYALGTPDIVGAFPRKGQVVWPLKPGDAFGNFFGQQYQRVADQGGAGPVEQPGGPERGKPASFGHGRCRHRLSVAPEPVPRH